MFHTCVLLDMYVNGIFHAYVGYVSDVHGSNMFDVSYVRFKRHVTYTFQACINDTFSYNYDNYASTEWVCEGEYENEVCYEVEVTGLDAYYLRSRLIQDMLSDTDQ